MNQMCYWNLIIRYPGLRAYINSCHIKGLYDHLWDFMVALETDESGFRHE